MTFTAAPEYQVFPTPDKPLKPYAAAVRAAREIQPFVHGFAPGHRGRGHPHARPGAGGGARGRAAGDAGARTSTRSSATGTRSTRSARGCRGRAPGGSCGAGATGASCEGSLEEGRDQYNETRRRLGLAPLPYVHTALSRELTMVGTLPQLEYPRRWEPWVRVVGPLQWEPPGERVEPPPGRGPVVLIAPSTSQDPSHTLLRAALEGLADAPVRVIATYNGREPVVADRRCPATPCSCRGCRTRRRCRCATWSCSTAATGRSCGRWRPAARWWPARRAAT